MRAPAEPNRPTIAISRSEAERLSVVAETFAEAEPEAAELLLTEIDRAEIYPDDAVPPQVVRMYSEVEFVDSRHPVPRTVQLVYPSQADISRNRISVVTLIGASLLGMSAGQSVTWAEPDGTRRVLRVVRVDAAT